MSKDKVNQEHIAFKAWPYLVEYARKRHTITYKELAKKLGIHHRNVRLTLSEIQDYCMNVDMPPLTILVVKQSTGRPGTGFIGSEDPNPKRIKEDTNRVYGYNWQKEENPFSYAHKKEISLKSMAKDSLSNHDNHEKSKEYYSRIKVRGIKQKLFREILLIAYDKKCAFCGLSFEEILEAAHIVPWNDADEYQRFAVTNGLLLCPTHHKLFDKHCLEVSQSHKIIYSGKKKQLSKADKTATQSLHNKKISLPKEKEHLPIIPEEIDDNNNLRE